MKQLKTFLGVIIIYFLLIVKVKSDCIWYGECGPSDIAYDNKYNCKYTGPALPLTNQTALELLKEVCPHIYNGNSTVTCCDSAQIVRYYNQLSLPKQLMSRCPACYRNFRTFLCDMTCSTKQSEFLLINQERPYKKTENTLNITSEVIEINYTITNHFVDQLYNSCKNVKVSQDQKLIDLICGSSQCSPKKLVTFLGNNPQSPFIFNINISDVPYEYNKTVKIIPMNSKTYLCNSTVDENGFIAPACECLDCLDKCYIPPPPSACSNNSYFGPLNKTTQLIVRPKNQSLWTYSIFSKADQLYGPALEIDFLHQVLDLQNTISALTGTFYDKKTGRNYTVSLQDICFQPLYPNNKNCTIQSILQYWQNNATLLDKQIEDEFGIKLADYITHFENCVIAPATYDETLEIDCIGALGGTIMPFTVLCGYPQRIDGELEYGNSTSLVITYVMDDDVEKNQSIMAWEQRLIDFLENEYENDELTVSIK